MSTIVALSSGRPPAAIGIVRISGPDAFAAASTLAGSLPPPRRAGVRRLRDEWGATLDRALVLCFPGPATATGEDLVELHCHGGRAVVDAVVADLVRQSGCRPAEPGEFTRRALENGRIDLAEAEGLADLLEAETERQRVAALAAAEGRISRQVERWLDAVALLSARIEVLIDYDEEVDTDGGAVATIAADAEALGREIERAASAAPVERLRDGVRIAIGGPPNAGKSTLLNLMSERDAAIVSPVAGTTRDVVEASVTRGGMAYVLLDTAGLHESRDPVETIGVVRAREAAAAADLLLWLGDDEPPRPDAIRVHARCDEPGREQRPNDADIAISRDRIGSIDALWTLVADRAIAMVPRADALPWRARHRQSCTDAAAMLRSAASDPLLLAEHLRRAATALAAIVGRNATEEMLDAMFSRFCLGK